MTPIQVFSCEYCGSFTIICFEEHLWTAAFIRCYFDTINPKQSGFCTTYSFKILALERKHRNNLKNLKNLKKKKKKITILIYLRGDTNLLNFIIFEIWICAMTRHHAESNSILTRNLPIDADVRQWSYPLMIPLHCLRAKSNIRTRGQFECDVTWFWFCFDFGRSHARDGMTL